MSLVSSFVEVVIVFVVADDVDAVGRDDDDEDDGAATLENTLAAASVELMIVGARPEMAPVVPRLSW